VRTTLASLLSGLTRAVDFPEPICEFGAYRVPGQEHLPPVASYFPNKIFLGCDLQPGSDVCQLQDLHALGLRPDSIGTVLLFDTIEHVREPWRAMDELHRCLKPGGVVVMTSVFFFPVHAYPDDYWRFTSSAFGVLLSKFDPVVVNSVGHARLPHTVIGIGSKGACDPEMKHAILSAVNSWLAHGATSWKERALMTLPPIAVASAYGSFERARVLFSRGRGRSEKRENST
jgi:SAM-dependent methyltransferase